MQLVAMRDIAFAPSDALVAAIQSSADAIHPYRDGKSSSRVVAATDAFTTGAHSPLRRRPLSPAWRGLQSRRDLDDVGRARG